MESLKPIMCNSADRRQSQLHSNNNKNNVNKSADHKKEELITSLYNPTYRIDKDDYRKYKILHGVKADYLKNKVRWDDN